MEQNFPGLLKSLDPKKNKSHPPRNANWTTWHEQSRERKKIPIEIEQITPPARSPPNIRTQPFCIVVCFAAATNHVSPWRCTRKPRRPSWRTAREPIFVLRRPLFRPSTNKAATRLFFSLIFTLFRGYNSLSTASGPQNLKKRGFRDRGGDFGDPFQLSISGPL